MTIGHGMEQFGNRCVTEDAGFVGTLFRRKLTFLKAGDYKQSHKHQYGHVHMVCKGVLHVECRVTGIDVDLEAGDAVWVPAEAEHFIYAKTDGAIGYCIFSGRTFQKELADTPEEVSMDIAVRDTVYV